MAKPLANGFPIGAILTRDDIAETMSVGSHGTTFGGQPLATRIGHYVLSRLSDPTFLSSMTEVAAYLDDRLKAIHEMFDVISAVRGRGMIRGLGFKDEKVPAEVVKRCRERGVLLLTAGRDAVRFVPPLIVSQADVKKAMDVLESVLYTLQDKPAEA